MTIYWNAPDVEEIAHKLILEHHAHLDNVRIKYVFRDKAANSKGAAVLGKARKISGLNAHLVALVGRDEAPGPVDFFVVEIAEDIWRDLTEEQRVALVDHELCHFDIAVDDDGDRRLVVRGHDLEEFAVVVERHGLWRPAVKRMATVMQLELDVNDGDDGGSP